MEVIICNGFSVVGLLQMVYNRLVFLLGVSHKAIAIKITGVNKRCLTALSLGLTTPLIFFVALFYL